MGSQATSHSTDRLSLRSPSIANDALHSFSVSFVGYLLQTDFRAACPELLAITQDGEPT